MVREEFVVDEGKTEGVGNDYDDAFGFAAIGRFGDVRLATVNLGFFARGCAIVLAALCVG